MARYDLDVGVKSVALRCVFDGSEGIGKSTLAAQMPNPVFIDVEGGTNQLPVARLPRPTSWTMLMDEVRAVRDGDVPCSSLVVDTADAAEILCARHVCQKNQWDSIESPGYGKGYTHLEEEFGRLLDLLSEVAEHGRNVVVLSHAIMRKFERPDESGAYDRFELKLSKKVAPKVKEWCDMLLFLDYKTFVVVDKNNKAKAQGGSRVVRTSHAPTWDAKNRFGLPDEMPLDDASSKAIAALMVGGEALSQPAPDAPKAGGEAAGAGANGAEHAPKGVDGGPKAPAQAAAGGAQGFGYPPRMKALADLMLRDRVSDAELRTAVSNGGYCPLECAATDYPPGFIDYVVTSWDTEWLPKIKELREEDIPF